MKNKPFLVLFTLIIFLALFFFIIIYFTRNKTLPLVSQTKIQEEQSDLPKLYPELSWSLEVKPIPESIKSSAGLLYGSYGEQINLVLDGNEWIAKKNNMEKNELYRLEENFNKYYDSYLLQNGWKTKIPVADFTLATLSADGPTGGIWGYLKEKNTSIQVIILNKKMLLKTPQTPLSLNCPCDVEFRIFVSNPIATETILQSKNK